MKTQKVKVDTSFGLGSILFGTEHYTMSIEDYSKWSAIGKPSEITIEMEDLFVSGNYSNTCATCKTFFNNTDKKWFLCPEHSLTPRLINSCVVVVWENETLLDKANKIMGESFSKSANKFQNLSRKEVAEDLPITSDAPMNFKSWLSVINIEYIAATDIVDTYAAYFHEWHEKNRHASVDVDSKARIFYFKRTGNAFAENSRPDMVIGFIEGYNQAMQSNAIPIDVKLEYFERPENHPSDFPEWYASIPLIKGIAESGLTKEDAFRELMISLAVKIAYDNKIDLGKDAFIKPHAVPIPADVKEDVSVILSVYMPERYDHMPELIDGVMVCIKEFGYNLRTSDVIDWDSIEDAFDAWLIERKVEILNIDDIFNWFKDNTKIK